MIGSDERSRSRWIGILQLLFSAAVLVWLFSTFGFKDIIDVLASVNGWLYGLAGLVFLLSIVMRAVRWHVMLTPLGARTSVMNLLWLYMIGFFWNSFLPTGFGGDVVKAVALRRAVDDGSAAVISVVAERVVGLLATSLIGLLAIMLWPALFPLWIIIVLVVIFVMIMLLLLAVRIDLGRWVEHPPLTVFKPLVTHQRFVKFHNTLNAYSLSDLGWGILVSSPFTLLSILDNYLVGLAVGIDLSILYYVLYTPVITIIGLLPISFNGVGVREYTYQFLFGMAGIAPQQAIAMALAFNILRFGAGILGGVVSLVSSFSRVQVTHSHE